MAARSAPSLWFAAGICPLTNFRQKLKKIQSVHFDRSRHKEDGPIA